MPPVRLSLITYNLWHTIRWPERRDALGKFIELYAPDVLCVQELRSQTQSFLDQAMPGHRRVHDKFEGWTCEGNIYWNAEFLEHVAHGAESIGMLEAMRRLFWVRLKVAGSEQTVLIATAHFTHQGHEEEMKTGQSPRLGQTRESIEAIERLLLPGEPALFAGDLNDSYLPPLYLQEAGYRSCFQALGQLSPPTWPCVPTCHPEESERLGYQTLDWIFANRHARAVAAASPHFFHGDFAPSDHWPVQAVYELREGTPD